MDKQREEFEKWAKQFNPMMAQFLIENLAFFETFQAGAESRQPEIDALKEGIGLCHGTLESRERNITTLMDENAALKAEMERLRKDAERYVFWRAQFRDGVCGFYNAICNANSDKEHDAAIDAAMKETK